MPTEKTILVGLDLPSKLSGTQSGTFDANESIDELATLAESAGGVVVDRIVQSRPKPDPATLIGSGKVEELAAQAKAFEVASVIFDNELSPTQQRNLEKALEVKILDRTQLILDIFARRARTREGQLQVELAQLSYLLPRLTGRGIEMSRQAGGIGTRGPGETQLETDRRKIALRIKAIGKELESVRAGRKIQRNQRQSVPLATIALVGYTNAGKSTLFNRMTGAEVLADAKMFATLDPTVRQILLPTHRKVLLSDTVGFIRNLPTTLVKAFRATLEEVREAELLLHVVDASAPDAAEHYAHVIDVLKEIESDETPQIVVLNKVDALGDLALEFKLNPAAIAGRVVGDATLPAAVISARTGEGMDALLELLDQRLSIDPVSPATFRFPVGDGSILHILHERARVNSTEFGEELCTVVADAPQSVQRLLQKYIVPKDFGYNA